MSQDRLEIVSKLKELQDPQCIEMLSQFMQYLMQNQQGNPGGSSKRTAKNPSNKSIIEKLIKLRIIKHIASSMLYS